MQCCIDASAQHYVDAVLLLPPLAGSCTGGLQLHGKEGRRIERGSVQAPGSQALISGHPACYFRKQAPIFISSVFHSVLDFTP